MRRFVLLSSALFLMLIGAVSISRSTAQSQKSPILKSYQPWMCGNSPPCWNSIYPGQTSLDEAELILSQAGFDYVEEESTYPMRWIRQDIGMVSLFQNLADNDGTVNAIEIEPKDMRLGEAILLFGSPVSATMCRTAVPYHILVRVYFSNDVFAEGYQPLEQIRISPELLIYTIGFFNDPVPTSRVNAYPWRGFTFSETLWQCGNPPEHQWY